MKRGRILAASLAGIALLYAGFHLGRELAARHPVVPGARQALAVPAEGTSGQAPAPADTAANAATPVAPAAPEAPAHWPALPAPGARVAAVFDELAARAAQGDSAAACRLARDLQRCGFALAQRELAGNLQEAAATRDRTPGALIDAIASIERRGERITEDCEGVQPAQLGRAFEFQRQAAEARPELRTWFALNPALDRRDFVTDLERWAEYRRVAMPWLEAAARRGDPVALIALARVHGDLRRNSPPWPPFRLDDPVRALGYHQRLIQLGATQRGLQAGADAARARLDAAGLARAEAFAAGLMDADAAPPGAEALANAMQGTFDPVPAAADCEPGR